MSITTIRTNQRFTRLTVVQEAGRTSRGEVLWLCRCDCGIEKAVPSSRLRTGSVKSCGCLRQEQAPKNARMYWYRHGHAASKDKPESPTYRTWASMIERCENPNSRSYKNYGARGISVHPLWRRDFRTFLRDVGERPSEEYSLDRINNFGDYIPGNVRWATAKQQMRNRRNNFLITIEGMTRTCAEWAEITGLRYYCIYNRYKVGDRGKALLREPCHGRTA